MAFKIGLKIYNTNETEQITDQVLLHNSEIIMNAYDIKESLDRAEQTNLERLENGRKEDLGGLLIKLKFSG